MAKGFSQATMKSFKAAAATINAAAAKLRRDVYPLGLRMIGEEIMTDVKNSRAGHGVPVRKGTLRGTGRVEGPTGEPPQVSLSFGGAAAPYALVQHEVLTFAHPVGEARYLVRGLERWSAGASNAMHVLGRSAEQTLNRGKFK